MTVRSVVMQHGSTTRRCIYVISLGQAPALPVHLLLAVPSYRLVVGRPPVEVNIPAGLHIAFRAKFANEFLWVRVKTFVGTDGQLIWGIAASDDESLNSPCTDARIVPTKALAGHSLQTCMHNFAVLCGRRSARAWLSPTEILWSTTRNWFTEYLTGRSGVPLVTSHPLATIPAVTSRGSPWNAFLLAEPSTNAQLFSVVAVPDAGINITPSSKMSDKMQRLRERLTVSSDALSQGHKARKRIREDIRRLRQKNKRCKSSASLEKDSTIRLLAECRRLAHVKGFAPIVGLRFAASLLENSMKAKNKWRWTDQDLAFFSLLLSRIGLHTYKFVASELGAPSVTTLQRIAGMDARDLLFSASEGVRRLAAYFDVHPNLPRRVIIQHDGVHIKQGVVWTKLNTFIGFVEQRESIAHFVLNESDLRNVEFAHTAEVFMLSALHTGVKHVVRVAPCSSGFSSVDYVTILDELLNCLDCNNIRPSAICFDAATPVVKGLKSLSDAGEVAAGANAQTKRDDGDNPEGDIQSAEDFVQMFAEQLRPLNRIAQSIFQTSSVPAELLRSIMMAHRRFPVYFIDPYSKEGVLLCGDSAHLLKRERNLVYSTRNSRRFVHVSYENELVPLRWHHVASLRANDKAAELQGLPTQEPLLTDNFVELNSWAKMSVPGALAVYNTRVIAALRRKAADVQSREHRRELEALAKHIEYGRSRFDVARSKSLNLLRKTPAPSALTSYDTPAIDLLRELEVYYNLQLEHGRTNSKSSIWAELVSTSVAMRGFVWRETGSAPEQRYVLLTHLSTDPLESLFSFVRQTNGGSSNPSLDQFIQGLRRHLKRHASSKFLRAIKGNLGPERNEELVQDIFLASAVVGQSDATSTSSELRAQKEQQGRILHDDSSMLRIIQAANASSKRVLDVGTRQITARICGALIAIERKKIVKQIAKLETLCKGETSKFREAKKEKLIALCGELRQIESWTLPSNSQIRAHEDYADIRLVERHDRLTYPVPALLSAMADLVVIRHHAVEQVLSARIEAHRLPIVLRRLFEQECNVDGKTTMNCDVLRRLVRRFTNSSCRSLQFTLNARCEALSARGSAQQVDRNVPLRLKLAVKSASTTSR